MESRIEEKELIKKEYTQNIPTYYFFLDFVKSTLIKVLEKSNIDYNQLDARVKTPDSFVRKIERKRWKYKDPFHEVTDILALRIVTYYREDIERIIKVLFREFDIDFDNSVNKLVNLDPDRMGYLSVHYVCRLKKDSLGDMDKNLAEKNIAFEIQIRTALQHAWAEIDHKLRYKTLVNIPKKIERKLFRISALLEMADSEFSHIREEIKAIEEFYENSISKEKYQFRLDASSLSFYLKANDKRIFNLIKTLQVYHYNTFSIAKEEKLERTLIKYALKFGINRIEHLHYLLRTISDNYKLIDSYLDESLRKKLRYLINSACTFFITAMLIVYEEEQELKRVYKLSDESLGNILELRKELIKDEKE